MSILVYKTSAMPAKFIQRFKQIDKLIAAKATGTPAEFAEKLDISESTLYEFLKVLKELDAPIEFDGKRNTYYYTCSGRMVIKFEQG